MSHLQNDLKESKVFSTLALGSVLTAQPSDSIHLFL
jgi:hypothetical protein